MNDDWMNHSMLCYIERDIFTSINDDKILDCFQSMRSRKKQIPHLASGKLFLVNTVVYVSCNLSVIFYDYSSLVFVGSGSSPMIDEEC